MTEAASDFAGTRHDGAKRPARPAAVSAPRMMPKSMTDVTSLNTLALSSALRVDQYGHEPTSTPRAASIFDPQSANADVMPQGRPASASVATLTAASPSAPAASGQGPRTGSERGLTPAR